MPVNSVCASKYIDVNDDHYGTRLRESGPYYLTGPLHPENRQEKARTLYDNANSQHY